MQVEWYEPHYAVELPDTFWETLFGTLTDGPIEDSPEGPYVFVTYAKYFLTMAFVTIIVHTEDESFLSSYEIMKLGTEVKLTQKSKVTLDDALFLRRTEAAHDS